MFKSFSTFTIKTVNIVLITVFISSCATIFTGTTDTVTFTTNADPVRVFISGRNVGVTPLTIDVNRQTNKGPIVRFEKEGYETQEFPLSQKFNTVAILDITSIVTSGGVDVFTGAIMEFSPKQYHVEMLDAKVSSFDDRQQQIQFARFVLFNSQNIQVDLVSDGGEYSDTLLEIIKTHDTNGESFEDWLAGNKEMLISTDGPEQFLTGLRMSQMTP